MVRSDPKGMNATTGLISGVSNPEDLYTAYGTFDKDTGEELDIHYTRSTDKCMIWETIDGGDNDQVNPIVEG